MGKYLNKAVNKLAYSNEYLLYRTLHIKHLKYTQYEASLNKYLNNCHIETVSDYILLNRKSITKS